ncbi:MAG: kelch repeat-containing protein [Syntrophaceae bacterium]
MSKRRLIFLILILLSFSFLACGGGGDGAVSYSPSAVQTVYSISGTVSGAVLGGVTITLSGDGSATTTTAADGSYVFAGVANGNYTVTPTLTGGTFSPASRTATVNGADVAGRDFVSSPSAWMWVSGPDTAGQPGIYGTKGVADVNNIPGGREYASSCADTSGNVWLFGGWGYDTAGDWGDFNDLWKYDGSNWTWVSGSNTVDNNGVYGTKGVAAAGNVPGARSGAVLWVDKSGNLWLFGGESLNHGFFNDLWKFDGSNWTWISGSSILNQPGICGTKGVADANNVPGARTGAVSWIDNSGNLWLFGGAGEDSSGHSGDLNDLWKYDGSNWTWISGSSDEVDNPGSYGTKGVADANNVPGCRFSAVSWIDNSGNLWLFGGIQHDQAGSWGFLNDLWKFDGSNWTWISGDYNWDRPGSYGTKGVADANNVPGGRSGASSSVDTIGNFWLFGGGGYDSARTSGYLNDLWKFDGSNWIWVSGSNTADQKGSYGTKGVADAGNVPGARYCAVLWVDNSGNLRLFGGSGYDSAGNVDYLNDLWRY